MYLYARPPASGFMTCERLALQLSPGAATIGLLEPREIANAVAPRDYGGLPYGSEEPELAKEISGAPCHTSLNSTKLRRPRSNAYWTRTP